MKFLVFCFGLVVSVCNLSFAQQQGNLKILNHQPAETSNNNLSPNATSENRGGLKMTGWQFDRPPRPNDNSTESGKIVFEIEVDNEGKIIACKPLEWSVTNSLMRLYKDAVLKSKLKPADSATKPASGAIGTVTFIIKSN